MRRPIKQTHRALFLALQADAKEYPGGIRAHVRDQSEKFGSIPGEQVTMAAQQAGIGADRDARAFGAIYAKAIRAGAIRIVGYCARVRGHGTSGGKLYAAG